MDKKDCSHRRECIDIVASYWHKAGIGQKRIYNTCAVDMSMSYIIDRVDKSKVDDIILRNQTIWRRGNDLGNIYEGLQSYSLLLLTASHNSNGKNCRIWTTTFPSRERSNDWIWPVWIIVGPSIVPAIWKITEEPTNNRDCTRWKKWHSNVTGGWQNGRLLVDTLCSMRLLQR